MSKLKLTHLVVGVLAVLIFLYTGLYMRWNFPEIYGENQAMRMLFRASHIYILLAGLLNLALGSYLVLSKEAWKKTLQLIGSLLILTATGILVFAFFHEPFLPKIERFFTFWAVILLLSGTTGHVIGSLQPPVERPTQTAEQKFQKLETERLVMRRFRETDLPAIFAYRNDPEVARYQRFNSVTEIQLSQMIRELRLIEPGAPGQWFQFAIASKETNELIGDCALRMDKEDPGRAEVGFTLARKYQGKGFAAEAVGRVIQFAFTELGLERIFALTDCENKPSIALLERLGLQCEGLLRRNFMWKGERRDEYRYAILKEEWPGKNAR